MKEDNLDLLMDISGELYKRLLADAEARTYRFSLTLRDSTSYASSVHQLLGRMENTPLKLERVSSWPGTRLFDAGATLISGPVSQINLSVLYEAESLFAWAAPDFPDDLVIYDRSMPVLCGIGHERIGWVRISAFSEHLHSALYGSGRPSTWFGDNL
jgi:hypothetical protein